jgi:hypothetical protein
LARGNSPSLENWHDSAMALAVSTVGAVLIAWVTALGLVLAWLWARGTRRAAHYAVWPENDRRRDDRRRDDLGPPAGMRERRAGFDRRASWVDATRLPARD